MSDKTPTAVEWLLDAMHNSAGMDQNQVDDIFQQAIEMEKQQIIDAYHVNPEKSKFFNCGIDYYTETYKP